MTPRVLHVAAASEFVQYVLLHELRPQRGRTDAVIACADGPGVAFARADGWRVTPIPIRRKLSPLSDLVTLWHLWRLLRRERPDVLHTYTPKPGLLGQIAGALAGVPRRIHSVHGLLYQPGMPAWRRRLYRATDRVTFALAHRVVFLSAADRATAVDSRLCPAGRARVTGSGVDLAVFSPERFAVGARDRVRTELGVGRDAVVALTVGRFVADKGYWELAQAAAAVAPEFPSLRFVWLAPVATGEDGVLPDSLLDGTAAHDRVVRLTTPRDPAPLYAAADLLVHPSYREGFPRVVMEAAAMALPIVATDIPGNLEVLDRTDFAALVPPRDAAALAAGLRGALRGLEELKARSRGTLPRVRQRLDLAALGERIWAVYGELLAR